MTELVYLNQSYKVMGSRKIVNLRLVEDKALHFELEANWEDPTVYPN